MTLSAERMISITRTLVGCLQAMLPLGNSEGRCEQHGRGERDLVGAGVVIKWILCLVNALRINVVSQRCGSENLIAIL